MSSSGLVKKFLVLLLTAASSLNGLAATDPCKQGKGVAVMVIGGALSGVGGAENLKNSLRSLVSDPNGVGVTWQAIGEDAYGLTDAVQNILHDLAQDDASLDVAAASKEDFLQGKLKKETKARDVILPFIGEFFANTKVTEPDTQRAASAAYKLLSAELKAGKRVLLIAHADGAFVMQATYEALSREFGASSVGRYSIAPLVDTGSAYISANEDLIVKAVRDQSGTAPVPNVNSGSASSNSLFSDDPVSVYLSTTSNLRNKIKSDITQALKSLVPTSSTDEPFFIQLAMVAMNDDYYVELNPQTNVTYRDSTRYINPDLADVNTTSNTEIIRTFTCSAIDSLEALSTHTITVEVRFRNLASSSEPMDPNGRGKLTATVNGHTQTIYVKPPLVFDDYWQKYVVSQNYDLTKVFPITLTFTTPADPNQPVTVSNTTPISPTNISASSRLTAKQSEDAVGDYYNNVLHSSPEYKPQVSFLGRFEKTYGTKDSTRPDWLQDNTGDVNNPVSPVGNPDVAVEVKNYDIQKNKRNLLKVIAAQIVKRYANLRVNAKQIVVLDLSGQPTAQANWSSQQLQNEINSAVATEATNQNLKGAKIDAIRYVGQLP